MENVKWVELKVVGYDKDNQEDFEFEVKANTVEELLESFIENLGVMRRNEKVCNDK